MAAPTVSTRQSPCSGPARSSTVPPRWARASPCQRRARSATSAAARRLAVRVAAFTEAAPAGSQVSAVPAVNSTSSIDTGMSSDRQLATKLSWAGAGIFFFWQLGAMKFLAERYDLTKVPMVGASGGALASVLAACGVPADLVLKHAYELSVKYNIWERPLGLLGVWGSLIEQWLDDLLPADAAERCRGRITMVVTTLPSLAQEGISDFKDKADLINVAMASSHIPIFLDMKFARYCRGKYCVDGSFPDFFYNANCDLLKAGGAAVIFDYFDDKNIKRKGRMDMLEVKTYEEVTHIMQLGYQYAAKLHGQGHFDHFELTGFSMDHMAEFEYQGAAAGSNGSNGADAGKDAAPQLQEQWLEQQQQALLVPATEA